MAREIAHGEISITLDIERLGNDLRAAEAQVARSLGNIDRMKAEADITADTKNLRRQVQEARSNLKRLQAEKADPKIGLDTKALTADIKKVQAQIQRLEAKKIKLDLDVREIDEAYAATKKLAAEEDKLYTMRGRQHMLARKQFNDDMLYAGKLQMEARKREAAEARAAEKLQTDRRRALADQQRAIDMDRNRAVQVEDLKLRYIRLHDEIERGSKLKMFDFLGDETARTKFAKTEAEITRVREQLVELGHSDKDFHRLGRASDSAGTRLRKMASSLGSVRLQMGFMSATLRQTAIGFTALGPVIFGLLGQIVSLVGVLGTGLTGALAVASAGAAGFGLSALGIGLIMKPLIGDLQDAMKASEAYGDAVRKYGRGSTQAQTAQEKLNKTLGDVGPEARKAFQSLGQMSDRWNKLTSGARPVFFETMASGIEAANKLIPTFAQESVRAFRAAGNETKKWFSMFSSPEATAGITRLMGNFTSALPGLANGLRSVFAGFSRAAVSASTLLPQLTAGFSTWGRNLERSIGSGAGLDARISRLVSHMREIGRFAQSSGAMLAAFFSSGANEGANLLSTLTSIFDRWTAWMHTAQGQNSLTEFFSQANSIGSQFVGTLARMGVALFEFSAAFAPLSTGFIAVISGVSGLVSALMGLGAARSIITGIGGALAGAFVAGKLIAAVTAIRAIGTALMGLRTAATAAALAGMLNPIVALGAVAGGVVALLMSLSGGADAAASSMDRLSAASSAAQGSMNSLAGIEAGMASAGVQLVAAKAAQAGAQTAYNKAVAKFGADSKQAQAAERALAQAMVTTDQARQQSNRTQKQYRGEVNTTNRKLAEEYNAQQKTVDSLKAKVAEESKYPTRARQYQEAVDDLAIAEKALADIHKKAVTYNQRAAQTELNAARARGGQARIVENIGAAWKRVRDVLPDAAEKPIINAVDPRDAARAIKLSDSLLKMGKGGAARKILLNTSDIDAALAKLRKLKAETTKSEKKKVNVDANTDPARNKIRTLNSGLKGRPAKVDVEANTKKATADIGKVSKKKGSAKVNVTADASQANTTINRISNRKISPKRVQISANAGQANTAIKRVDGAKIAPKKFSITANTDDADSANKKIQGFKDKTVHVKTQADTSGAQNAQDAINAIPANTNKYVTIIERKVKGAAQGTSPSDQPVSNATRSAGPRVSATDRRNAGTAAQANVSRKRAGLFKRPTLLVGEEREDEYVIATNPSHRAANEGYLRDAAARFGYSLAPIQMAAKGYKPLKFNAGRGTSTRIASIAQKFPRYDFLQGEISRWGDTATGRETRRAQDIEIDGTSSIGVDDILGAYQSQMGAYKSLRSWLLKQVKRMSGRSTGKGGTMAKERKFGRQADRLKNKLGKQRKKLRGTKDDKKRKAVEKDIAKTERALTKATSKRDTFRNKTRDANTMAGQFSRELNQSLPGQMYSLDTTIDRWKAIRDGKLPDPSESGGSGGSSTPMGVQLAALDQARYDAFNQFAGNVGAPFGSIPGGALGGTTPPGLVGASAPSGGILTPNFYRAKAGGSAAAGTPTTTAAPTGGGQTIVNQEINISEPPPDPHSFSKQLGWEAGLV